MNKILNDIEIMEDKLFKMHELFYDLCYIINYLVNQKTNMREVIELKLSNRIKDLLANKKTSKWEKNISENKNSKLISNEENSFEEFKDYQEAVKEAYYVLNILLKKYIDIDKLEDMNIVNGINYVLSEKNLKSLEVTYDQ